MADQQSVALTRSRPAYAVDAIAHPASKFLLFVGFGAATMIASVTLALVAVVVTVVAAWAASGSGYVRHHFDQLRDQRDRRARLGARAAQLAAVGVDPTGLVELTALVEVVETADQGWTARRFELVGLLDRYVTIAIAHQRCVYAMHTTDRAGLIRALASTPPRVASDVARCRRDLLERRIATWDRTAQQATRCSDELAAIVDLVRLLAQRASCPDTVADADLIQWRLSELDAEDAAMAQLTAGESEAA